MSEVTFSVTSRNGKVLIYNGYEYIEAWKRADHRTENCPKWRCRERKQCNARLFYVDGVATERDPHTHAPGVLKNSENSIRKLRAKRRAQRQSAPETQPDSAAPDPIPSLRTTAAPASTRRPLQSSTKANQMKPQSTPWISYRELIRAVGIDPELNPSSWRKSIDHSAETVVFFQVDLRGALPRMSKSVRVCRDQLSGEDKQGRLIPTVFVDETQLSSDYVKAVIGRRFLSDEDDLMKLLEHVGVLRPDEEAVEGQENDGRDNVYQEDETENISYLPQPEPKRARFAGRTDFGQRIERIAANRSHTGTGSHQTESAGSAYRTPSDLPPYPRSATAATDHLPTGVADEKAAEVTDADVEMGGSAVEDDDDNFPLPEYVQHDVPGSSAHHNDEEHLESGLEDENDVEDATDETPGEEGTGEAELFTHQETTVLIDNVKAHPVLWRKQNQSGSTTDRTRQQQLAWEKVTAAVSRATVAGKPKKTSQQCSRKWGSLHAYFRMILPTTKEDEALRNRWPFTQQMMFTKSEDKMRKRHGNSLENR